MSENNQNNNALALSEMYPSSKFNLLVPVQVVAEISAIQRPVMNSVMISTNLDDKEIYEQEKAMPASGKFPARPAKYAITKRGLTKLMRAAGIKIKYSKPVVPSTCQKCAEMNARIGKPVNCGNCRNKDVKYEVCISVPQLTGENLEIIAHKEIIVDDVTADMTPKQKSEFMKFRSEMCESKALNRALRMAMQIKGTYQIEEFKKPFVVAYLVPNLDNPEVRERAIASFFSHTSQIYGDQPQEPPTRRIDVDEVADDEDEAPIYGELGAAADDQEPEDTEPEWAHKETQSEPPQAPQGAVCDNCGAEISEKVFNYSINKFGRPLCFNCQKNAR